MYRTKRDFNKAINLIEIHVSARHPYIMVEELSNNIYRILDAITDEVLYTTRILPKETIFSDRRFEAVYRYDLYLIDDKNLNYSIEEQRREFMNGFKHKSKDVYNANTLLYLNWSLQEEYKLKYNRPVPYLKELILNEFLNNY